MNHHIVFFGSSKHSVIVARALENVFGLTLIVTLPDKSMGRKKILTPSPVKSFALRHNIPILEAQKLSPPIISTIITYKPDFLIVADYGLILPSQLLLVPTQASLNVHHSLLPKFRGASPAPSAILANESITGVSIISMDDKVDTGDVLIQKSYTILPNDTTDSLLTRLNLLGAEILISVINDFQHFVHLKQVQDEKNATYTRFMKKTDGFIDIHHPPPPDTISRMIRAYFPWPGVWTKISINGQERILKLLPNHYLQMEGKKPVHVKEFINGYPQLKKSIEPLIVSYP